MAKPYGYLSITIAVIMKKKTHKDQNTEYTKTIFYKAAWFVDGKHPLAVQKYVSQIQKEPA